MLTNKTSGTNVHEIAAGIYRINTPVSLPGAGKFNFNQYLIRDEAPLLYHTGPRKMFALVREAISRIMPVEDLRYIGFSHFEADECGALNEFLAIAAGAEPVCGKIAAMVSVNDVADRPAHALADGDILDLGHHRLRWVDTPHLPHAWECGLLMDTSTRTMLCGDLFTQDGDGAVALTESDILGPAEASRRQMDYYAHAPDSGHLLERLAREQPETMACMHGSAWRGDGANLLRALAQSLQGKTATTG